MINSLKISILIILSISLFFSLNASGQSISGNANMLSNKMNLGFANVNIYKNNELVANLFTDSEGNFSVKLDTGLYKCEIIYAGFEKIEKEIFVKGDEKAEFSLKKDMSDKYSSFDPSSLKSPEILSDKYDESYDYEISEKSRSESKRAGIMAYSSTYKRSPQKKIIDNIDNLWKSYSDTTVSSGKLTAGEINDFSKWNLWNDLTSTELLQYQELWKISPQKRYVVQLSNYQNIPIVNSIVRLKNKNKILFETKTDNTGKAELWAKINIDSEFEKPESIEIIYKDIVKSIKNISEFENGINFIQLNVSCVELQNIDIAFVVDATGSMQDEIDYLKYDLNNVIFNSKKISNTLSFRFANIFYRDINDAYLTKIQGFTSILSESVAFTNNHNADGGGDEPEAVEVALDSAINKLDWNKDAKARLLFLVLDASPHNNEEVINKLIKLSYQAAAKGIRIIPLAGSGSKKETEYLMRSLALITNGTYTFLTNHSGIGGQHIEPSTDEYRVEILNDLLIRIIKSFTYTPNCNNEIPDLGINLPDSIININSIDDNDTINDIKDELIWRYYPNPTNGIINIVSNKDIDELYISDLTGKVLIIKTDIKANYNVQIDLSSYTTGVYLIRYPNGKQFISGKIILVR